MAVATPGRRRIDDAGHDGPGGAVIALAGALLAACAIGNARAEPATPSHAAADSAAVRESCVRLERSAYRWSLGSTVVPIVAGGLWVATQAHSDDLGPGVAVAATGLMAGPAVGYAVGGCWGRGLGGIGLRTAIAAGAGIASFFIIAASEQSSTNFALQNLGVAVLVVGGIGIAASTVVDVSHVRRIVRERCTTRRGAHLEIEPVMLAAGDGVAPGIQLRARFGP